jgi:hypothetical protein
LYLLSLLSQPSCNLLLILIILYLISRFGYVSKCKDCRKQLKRRQVGFEIKSGKEEVGEEEVKKEEEEDEAGEEEEEEGDKEEEETAQEYAARVITANASRLKNRKRKEAGGTPKGKFCMECGEATHTYTH